MTKYSEGFKKAIVQEYLSGNMGYDSLAEKYQIPSSTPIKNWVAAFRKWGNKGLERKRNQEVYPVQFKLDVLNFMKRTGASLTDTALHFGLNNPPMISSWNKKFLEGGAEALDIPRGRPAMNHKKNGKKENHEKETTREQQLERENELLRLEVDYLKKLRAFQMDPEGYLERHKQRYHSNSKKDTD